jgi:YD repeat-containing protein
MNTKTLFFLMFVVFCFGCSPKGKNDLDKEKLFGKVKYLEETFTNNEGSSKRVRKVWFDRSGFYKKTLDGYTSSHFFYGEGHQLTKRVDSSINEKKLSALRKWNSEQKTLEITSYTDLGAISSTEKHKFNDQKQILSQYFYNSNGELSNTILYKYNSENRLSQVNHDQGKGKSSSKENYVYDKEGKLIEIKSIYYKDGKKDQTTTDKYEYDDQGRLIKTTSTNHSATQYNRSSEQEYGKADKYKNWLKKKVVNHGMGIEGNGGTFERKIEYY